MILVAPVWPQEEWFANLLSLIVEIPSRLPMLWTWPVQPHIQKSHRGLEWLWLQAETYLAIHVKDRLF